MSEETHFDVSPPCPDAGRQSSWSLRIDSRYDKRLLPLHESRMLIGSGEVCAVRLEAEPLPELFGVLVVNDDSITVEQLNGQPRLIHDGVKSSSIDLKIGESVELGAYRLTLLPVSTGPGSDGQDDLDTFRPDQTITELIEMIEREEEFANTYLQRQESGMQALLQAVEDAGIVPVPAEDDAITAQRHAA